MSIHLEAQIRVAVQGLRLAALKVRAKVKVKEAILDFRGLALLLSIAGADGLALGRIGGRNDDRGLGIGA
ncbi:MAG: hypothetical protein GWN66_00105 [Pseudomonas stutzeri]|nr:hypothetical protein [Stutzerimonas stutzeri]